MNKLLILFLICLLSSACIFFWIITLRDDTKNIKFLTSYYFLNKSISSSDADIGSCIFSYAKLKNNVELKCQPLREICDDNNVPTNNKLVNKDTACSIITLDINGFDHKPNIMYSKNKKGEQFQVLRYKNGIVTIPDSSEYVLLKGKGTFFKNLRYSLLIWDEMKIKHPELNKSSL